MNKDWLRYPGSFMQRLREHGINHPEVQVLMQDWQIPLPDEQACLNIPLQMKALAREVLITSGENIWMYARTIFPSQTLTGELSHLAKLENRSLGSALFGDPALQRSEFDIECLQPGMFWYEKTAQHVKLNMQAIWSRRSIFNLHGKEILLTEIFLPDMEKVW